MIEFYQEVDKPAEVKKLRPHIEIDSDGANLMVAEEGNKHGWYVCTLTNDGRLFLAEGIPGEIGLQVDSEGRIELAKGDDDE